MAARKPKAAPALPGEGTFVRHDLMSTDPERSNAFYGELFGWTLEPVSFAGMSLTRITAGGIRLGAIMPFDPSHGIPSHWVPYVSAADVDATCKKVTALGGTVCMGGMEIPVGRFALCAFPAKALFSPFTPKEPRAMPHPPPVGAFCWDELLTSDVASARAFYAGLFGWTPKAMAMPGGAYIVMELGGSQVCGIMESPANAPSPPSWLCYVAVEDVDGTMRHAQQLGAKVSAPPRDIPGIGRFCVLADPTGAAIAIFRAATTA